MISIAAEPLVYRWTGFSPALSLLMPTFAFLSAPHKVILYASPLIECSPTSVLLQSRASVLHLMPDYYRCPVARPVSCYALFKGIAASKLTSWLSQQLDLLSST